MIDLTPLDVRNKRGDFKKTMRGYDPQEVDVFLEIAAERLEALVRETLQLRERAQSLQEQVTAQTGREQAVQDALVTAQELRTDIRTQSQREADHLVREAEASAGHLISEAEADVRAKMRGVERQLEQAKDSLQEMERRRARFLKEFRGLLSREMDVVDVEESRVPLEERPIDLELGGSRSATGGGDAESPSRDAGSQDEVMSADEPVDVSDLQPSSGQLPDMGSEPGALEVELMADAEGKADALGGRAATPTPSSQYFPEVPDLETVLAEAGVDETGSPGREGHEIAPPAIQDRQDDIQILFDPDDENYRR